MSHSIGPVGMLLVFLVYGTIGAMVTSCFVKREKTSTRKRAPEPYIGFLFGAIVGFIILQIVNDYF
jgi:hypothetical protein